MDDGTTGLAGIESAHTSGRKSARTARIELITRGERRRRWTAEEKQAIAAQSRIHPVRTACVYAL